MKFTGEIIAHGDCTKLIDAIKLELGNFGRSTIQVEPCEEGAKFTLCSDDATALRATLNALTQSLSIYEKMQNLQ
ncbi:hypothetical protein D6774_02555 [Candidatus Woesearchaeota archaeon]|jgi:hypothetical protein|nr:MAG: hypothetical protein D6774_02555 [Candidatus Woesearchaeota archaeon]